MDINFFIVWFFISPFIILHLYLKNKDYKDKANQVVQQINDVWDKEYKQIISSYGTVSNFLDCHKQDYDIIRSNIVLMYSQISDINRKYMTKTEKLLELIENNRLTKKEIYEAVKLMRRDICIQVDELLTQINAFVASEEEAHSDDKDCIEALDELDEKYKNNNIYREVNKD